MKTAALRLPAVVALGVCLCLGAERLGLTAQSQDAPIFTSESSLVVLHVTVKDRHGRYINGLSRDAFAIFDDGRPHALSLFTDEDAPATIGLLVDTSGSMQTNRGLVLEASEAFVERSNPRDEIFGLTFNERVRAALPEDKPFTSDAAALREALASAITTQGRTALYDAIDDGVEYLSAGQYERKVLVVISDGGDNASETTFDQIRNRIQASNVVIHAVSLVDPVDHESNPKRLRQLAEVSGGLAFGPRDAGEVRTALDRVAAEIRNSYTLGYPASDAAPGFHRIRVDVRVPNARDAVARTRTGYMAGPGPVNRHDQ